MNPIRIQCVTAEAGLGDVSRAERIALRAIELLGHQLASCEAVVSRPRVVLDIAMPRGTSDEQMARKIARELASELS